MSMEQITELDDPCPLPTSAAANKDKKRTLKALERTIYAPMSDVSGIMFDKVCLMECLHAHASSLTCAACILRVHAAPFLL